MSHTQSEKNPMIKPERPKNWIIESIIVMLLIMLPCGLVALVYGCKVDKNYDGGDYSRSIRMARLSARWNLIGVCTGIPLMIIYYLLV